MSKNATLFVSHRNITLSTTMGHTIEFKKGEPTHVPKEVWKDALAIGAVPADDIDDEQPQKNEELDPEDRKAMILAAMEEIVTKGDRESFTGSGSPHAKVVSEIVGFTVAAPERDAVWAELRQSKAD